MTAPRTRVVPLLVAALVLLATCDDAADLPAADGATVDLPAGDSAGSADVQLADAPAEVGSPDASTGDLLIKRDVEIEGGPLPDAGTTPCGLLPCNNASQICVSVQIGGPERPSCKAVPAGCSDDRSCSCFGTDFCENAGAICGGTDPSCVDGAPGDNRLSCICPGQR